MPIEVKLNEELQDGVWSATGSFSNSHGQNGDAEVLVKVTPKTESESASAQLILDASVRESEICGHKVLSYTNALPVPLKSAKKGIRLEFSKVWFAAKR